jgi:hypothetical protein
MLKHVQDENKQTKRISKNKMSCVFLFIFIFLLPLLNGFVYNFYQFIHSSSSPARGVGQKDWGGS